MITINAKEANMAQLLNNVEYEPVTIVGDNGRNAVLISEDEWRGIQETLYLNSIPGLAESIMEAAQTPVDACVPEEDVEW